MVPDISYKNKTFHINNRLSFHNISIKIVIIIFSISLIICILVINHFNYNVPGTKEKVSVTNISKPEKVQTFGHETIIKEPSPRAEICSMAVLPDSIGNVYFAGTYKNTGSTAIGYPMVSVVLYSSADIKVAAGRGYTIRHILYPGEETPIIILVQHPPKYTRHVFSVKSDTASPLNIARRPKLRFRNTSIKKGQYGEYILNGEIINIDKDSARHINVIALINNAAGKIIAHGTDYIKEDSIQPKDYSPFQVRFYTKATPDSYRLDYNAQTMQ